MVCGVINRFQTHTLDKICCFIGGGSIAWAASLIAEGARGLGPCALLAEGVVLVAVPILRSWFSSCDQTVHPLNTYVPNPLPIRFEATVGDATAGNATVADARVIEARTARAARVSFIASNIASKQGSGASLAFTSVAGL